MIIESYAFILLDELNQNLFIPIFKLLISEWIKSGILLFIMILWLLTLFQECGFLSILFAWGYLLILGNNNHTLLGANVRTKLMYLPFLILVEDQCFPMEGAGVNQSCYHGRSCRCRNRHFPRGVILIYLVIAFSPFGYFLAIHIVAEKEKAKGIFKDNGTSWHCFLVCLMVYYLV